MIFPVDKPHLTQLIFWRGSPSLEFAAYMFGGKQMASFWDSEELIGKMNKNNREEIQIKKVEKKGKTYIDIRTFWYDGESDDFKPSQKGVTIPFENFEEFKGYIDKI